MTDGNPIFRFSSRPHTPLSPQKSISHSHHPVHDNVETAATTHDMSQMPPSIPLIRRMAHDTRMKAELSTPQLRRHAWFCHTPGPASRRDLHRYGPVTGRYWPAIRGPTLRVSRYMAHLLSPMNQVGSTTRLSCPVRSGVIMSCAWANLSTASSTWLRSRTAVRSRAW